MARRGQRILPVFMTQLLSTRGNFFFQPASQTTGFILRTRNASSRTVGFTVKTCYLSRDPVLMDHGTGESFQIVATLLPVQSKVSF